MRISKVYTRTGDSGKTRLAGGQEVWKDSLRVDVYGTVDELNSIIGLVRVFNGDTVGRQTHATRLEESLRWVQNKLFDLGRRLLTGKDIAESKKTGLHNRIDPATHTRTFRNDA